MTSNAATSGVRSVSRKLQNLPLRLRLTALLVALLAIAMLVTGSVATSQLHSYLIGRQDAELRAAAPGIAQAGYTLKRTELDRSIATQPSNVYAVRVVFEDGTHLTDIPESYGSSAPDLDQLNPDATIPTKPFTVDSTDGSRQWRVIEGRMDGDSGEAFYAVAVPLDRVSSITDRLILVIAVAGTLVLLLTALLGWFAVRRAMRPLRRIEETAGAIAGGDLTQRIELVNTSDEVGSLSKSLNVMLARIEESFAVREASEERMRQFVADASHELRTPLATVRGYAELFRQGAVSRPEDVSAAIRRIEDEATRMGVMVDDLLLLTRLERRESDPGTERPFGPVDLTVIAADAVQDAIALEHDRPVRLLGLGGAITPTQVLGDEPALRQVVTNLMANAIRYSGRATPIEVLVGTVGNRAQLHVRDHGEGVAAEAKARIFERFYRADASRNSSRGGSGLGLAIVSAIAEAHDGTVFVKDTSGGGATFVLDVPNLKSTAQSAHSRGVGRSNGATVE